MELFFSRFVTFSYNSVLNRSCGSKLPLDEYKPDKISKTSPTDLQRMQRPIIAQDIGSIQNGLPTLSGHILSERLRSGKRFLHFCYHEVKCDRASKHHRRMAKLGGGGQPLFYQCQCCLKWKKLGLFRQNWQKLEKWKKILEMILSNNNA